MSGGKDIKIGHDKRPVSVVPRDEEFLYNFNDGSLLTDEFGNPLVTEVEQYFLADASSDRSTSVVFTKNPKDDIVKTIYSQVGIVTGTYGVDLDLGIKVKGGEIPVLQANGSSVVGVGSTVLQENQNVVTLNKFPSLVNVRTKDPVITTDKNNIYFPESEVSKISEINVGDKVSGVNIPTGSFVVNKTYDRISISEHVNTGTTTGELTFRRATKTQLQSNNVLKIEEQFAETSEVSTTLLGIDRAEVQLSLFSNVSSYGLNSNEWESYTRNEGVSNNDWETRNNSRYGQHYLSRIEEVTTESAIKLAAFPVPYSYPFDEDWNRVGAYRPNEWKSYLAFVQYGNDLYNFFTRDNYSSAFVNKFLNPDIVKRDPNNLNKVIYKSSDSSSGNAKYDIAFAEIDDWTETWRDLSRGILDPILGGLITDANLKGRLKDGSTRHGVIYETGASEYDTTNTTPGYFSTYDRYAAIQSRRVFRYQPGRISGFTFGLRSSVEVTPGVSLEWGAANETDQYMFKIYNGQLSIIRRSKVPLSPDVLTRNGLDPTNTISVNIDGTTYETVQPEIESGDPYDVDEDPDSATFNQRRKYHTIEIKRDNFNGDALNGNGPSGYNIQADNVTMWKIEFGWYGAIGARFYAYIPAGVGDARWVVVHTLVIENSLDGPCLRDSYFRFKYSLKITDNRGIRQPQFLYKYGASYYIDGGDEGTSKIFSASTGLLAKNISSSAETSVIGVKPKEFITNSTGKKIGNRKLIIPTKMNVSADTLTEIKVKTCKGCPGHSHVFTPGVVTGKTGRKIQIEFVGSGDRANSVILDANNNPIVGLGTFFTEDDIGAKLIAPSIFNAYITAMDGNVDTTYQYGGKPRYNSVKVYGWGPGFDGYPDFNESGSRNIGGAKVIDYGRVDEITGSVGVTSTVALSTDSEQNIYPHEVRLSNYDVEFASDLPLTGSEININFLNPISKDGISSYKGDTHFADFLIGVTDQKPQITSGSQDLLGWDVPWTDYSLGYDQPKVGSGITSKLPKDQILFAEHTHSFASINQDGFEQSEEFSNGSHKCRMNQDVRIPRVPDPSGGECSTVKITINQPVGIATVNQLYGQNPAGGTSDPNQYYIFTEGKIGDGINDFLDGEVAWEQSDGSLGDGGNFSAKYQQNEPVSYFVDGVEYQYIKVSASVRQAAAFGNGNADGNDTNIRLLARPVKLTASRQGRNSIKLKLFKFNPFPLFLVGKLMDNAKIHNISISEKNTSFQKTSSPKLYISQGSVGSIDNANNNTSNFSIPPTNFIPATRLSSAAIDTQNEQPIRKSVTRDIFYVGENEVKEVDMTKIFGVDRNVITPDNLNIEATFLTAKQLGTGSNKTVQLNLNYKEQ